jgi:hypothetical protein
MGPDPQRSGIPTTARRQGADRARGVVPKNSLVFFGKVKRPRHSHSGHGRSVRLRPASRTRALFARWDCAPPRPSHGDATPALVMGVDKDAAPLPPEN